MGEDNIVSTFYDLLQLSPQASRAEIEAAIDASYNHNRQLVTHPDPATRARAEEALHLLGTVRSTLLDAKRRAAYDADISLSGAGGLADPTAAARPTPPPPPSPRPTPQAVAAQPASAWQCSACHTVNPPGTAHCQQCGRKLAEPCPSCSNLTPLTARFCGSCGTDLTAARAARDRKLAAEKEAVRQSTIANLEIQIAAEQSQIDLNNRLAGKWMSQWELSRNRGRENELLRTGGLSRGLMIALWAAALLLAFFLCNLFSAYGSGGVYLVLGLLAAGLVMMIVMSRRAKQRGADKLNATHQTKIAAMKEEIRRLRES